jgi:hypothetical protein
LEKLSERFKERPLLSRLLERLKAIRDRLRGKAPPSEGGGGETPTEGHHY